MTELDKLALGVHQLITFVVGSIAFLIALWVIYRGRHDDASHRDQPEQLAFAFRSRRLIFGTFIALGLAWWPVTAWAAPLSYCNLPTWWVMWECWFL